MQRRCPETHQGARASPNSRNPVTPQSTANLAITNRCAQQRSRLAESGQQRPPVGAHPVRDALFRPSQPSRFQSKGVSPSRAFRPECGRNKWTKRINAPTTPWMSPPAAPREVWRNPHLRCRRPHADRRSVLCARHHAERSPDRSGQPRRSERRRRHQHRCGRRAAESKPVCLMAVTRNVPHS